MEDTPNWVSGGAGMIVPVAAAEPAARAIAARPPHRHMDTDVSTRGPSTRTLEDLARRLVRCPPGWLHAVTGPLRRPATSAIVRVRDPDDLIGTVADRSWWGVGLVLTGRATVAGDTDDAHDDPARELGAPAPRGGRSPSHGVTVGYVATRHGRGALAIRDGDDVQVVGDGVTGYVADVVRRVLGIGTPPEPTTTAVFVVACWLRRLLDVAADPATSHRLARWSDAVALHPAVLDGDGRGLDPDDLAHLTDAMAREVGWRRMRELAIAGQVDVAGLTPGEVAWMDWPFFARWMLSVHRPVADLLDDLSLFVDGALLRDLRCTVDAVSWLGFAGPGADQPTGDG